MNRPFTLALLLCLPAFAADQIVLTNGDTLTGTIVRKDGAKLDIKSELLGEVEIPWKAIKSIDSNSEVFVQLPSGEVIKGKLAMRATSWRSDRVRNQDPPRWRR